MSPKDLELEDRQESDVRQKEGGEVVGVGDDESNRAPPPEDQAALVRRLFEENARLLLEKKESNRMYQALEQKHQEVVVEKNQLVLEKKESDRKYQEVDTNFSVQALLETHGGMPPMKENTSAKPSVGGKSSAKNTLKRSQAERGATAGASKVAKIAIVDDEVVGKQQHAPADIISMQEQVLVFMKQFVPNLKDQKGNLVKSMISLSMAENSTNKEATLTNFNEEISIFSMRPDVVVVRWESKIILVVEVKNAGKDGTLVMNNRNAAGQAYDYAMGLCQMGNEHPFVCLSTYDCMRIGTIKPFSQNIFFEAVKKLDTGMIQDVDSQPFESEKEIISPEKKGNSSMIPDDSNTTQLEDEKEIGESGQGEEPKREIYFSETFDRTNIFQALCFAVACGLVAAEKSTDDGNETLVPKEGAEINKDVAIVSKASLHWGRLKCKATYRLKSQWQKDMRVFLHCVLGQGCS